MKPIFTQPLTILPGMCDFDGLLGVPNIFSLFMDIATEHAEALHVGMNDLMPQGLFWLTVRTKARFYRRPGLTERVTAITWPEPPERSRCYRDYAIEKNGEVLVEGRTEWMIMNMKTGRLVPTDTVFPRELDFEARRTLPEPFLRLSEDPEGAAPLGAYTVRATDIDLGGHMNNAAYLRALAGAFSSKAWRDMAVHELEASYRSPCFEGETLQILQKTSDDGREVLFTRDGKAVFLARIR